MEFLGDYGKLKSVYSRWNYLMVLVRLWGIGSQILQFLLVCWERWW